MTTQNEMFQRLNTIDRLLGDFQKVTIKVSQPKKYKDSLYRAIKRRGWKWKFKIVKSGVRIERY